MVVGLRAPTVVAHIFSSVTFDSRYAAIVVFENVLAGEPGEDTIDDSIQYDNLSTLNDALGKYSGRRRSPWTETDSIVGQKRTQSPMELWLAIQIIK